MKYKLSNMHKFENRIMDLRGKISNLNMLLIFEELEESELIEWNNIINECRKEFKELHLEIINYIKILNRKVKQ